MSSIIRARNGDMVVSFRWWSAEQSPARRHQQNTPIRHHPDFTTPALGDSRSVQRSFIGFLNDLRITLNKSGVPSLKYLSQYSSPICGGFDEFWENCMLLGYARISTDSQDHALQLDALRAAGCDKVFVETASGTRTDRPELAKLMEVAREGDTVVCWRLDRIGRSLRHLIEMAERLQQRGIAFRSLTENIDTSTHQAGSYSTSSGHSGRWNARSSSSAPAPV